MRYNFSLFRKYVWIDMFRNPKYLFGMFGLRQTIKYMILDTLKHYLKGYYGTK